MVHYRWMGALVRAHSGLIVIASVQVCFLSSLGHGCIQVSFTSISTHHLLFLCSYISTSDNLLSSSSPSFGFLLWVSFSVTFLECLSLPVLDFLGGGASWSDLSPTFDSSSFHLDLLCGLPANLSYCWPPCISSLIPDRACWTTLNDKPHFSATAQMLPMLLIILSPTAITTTILW